MRGGVFWNVLENSKIPPDWNEEKWYRNQVGPPDIEKEFWTIHKRDDEFFFYIFPGVVCVYRKSGLLAFWASVACFFASVFICRIGFRRSFIHSYICEIPRKRLLWMGFSFICLFCVCCSQDMKLSSACKRFLGGEWGKYFTFETNLRGRGKKKRIVDFARDFVVDCRTFSAKDFGFQWEGDWNSRKNNNLLYFLSEHPFEHNTKPLSKEKILCNIL